MADTAFDKIVYNIRSRYCARMDADEEEEEEPKKKKATGWGARLPYGLCKSLGIDTTGMTPTEAWEAYESETGKTAGDTYKEKAEKGVGHVIDTSKKPAEETEKETEEESSGTLDYSSMTKDELEKKSEEISKKILDIFNKYGGAEKIATEKMSDEDTEEWEKLDGELGKIYDHLYSGVGGTGGTEEESIGEEDYSTWTQEQLKNGIKDLNAQIDKFYQDHPENDLSDDLYNEVQALYDKRSKMLAQYEGSADDLGPSETPSDETGSSTSESEEKPFDISTASVDDMVKQYADLKEKADEQWHKIWYDKISEEEWSDAYDKHKELKDEASKIANALLEKGIKSDGTPTMTQEELESELGGTVNEFLEKGGYELSNGEYIYPLTGEVVFEGTAKKHNGLAEYYKSKATPKGEEDPVKGVTDYFFKPETEESTSTETTDVESLKTAIKHDETNIQNAKNALKFIGFTEKDIEAENFDDTIAKYKAAQEWYKTNDEQKQFMDDAFLHNGTDEDDQVWFYSEYLENNPEAEEKWKELNEANTHATQALNDYGIYNFDFTGGEITEPGMGKENVDKMVGYSESAKDFINDLKEAKASKAEHEKQLYSIGETPDYSTWAKEDLEKEKKAAQAEADEIYKKFLWSDEDIEKLDQIGKKVSAINDALKTAKSASEISVAGSGETSSPSDGGSSETVEETPTVKKYKTIKSLQKAIDKNNSDLESIYDKEYKVGEKTHTYKHFKEIAEGGTVTGISSIEDVFDRADKMKAVYDAVDKKNEWKEAHNGKEPSELLSDGMPYLEYKALSKEYKGLQKAVTEAQFACSKYGISFSADGVPLNATKKMVETQLKWKELMMPDIQKAKQLEAEKIGLDSQMAEKQNKAEIKALTKEKTALNNKAKELQQELDEMPNKTYSGIWKHDVTTADYEGLNIQGKKDYYQDQLSKLGDSPEDQEKKEKFEGYLAQLNELEAEGPAYVAKKKELDQTKAAVKDKQNSINVLTGKSTKAFGSDAYTQERKDKALWAKSPKQADDKMFDKCSDVWLDSSQEQRTAAYRYTSGSQQFNEPLRGLEHYGKGASLGKDGMAKQVNDLTDMIEKSSYDFDCWLQRTRH